MTTILYILGAIVALFIYLVLGKIGIRIFAYLIAIINEQTGHTEDFDYDLGFAEANNTLTKIFWPIFIVFALVAVIIIIVVIMIIGAVKLVWTILKFIGRAFKWAWSSDFGRK